MASKKWKRFEDLAASIQKQLAPNARIEQNARLYGHNSKTNREIDILITENVGQYALQVVIDCKDYKRNLDVNDVGAFVDLLRDVRANKGAMIAARGYSEAACNRAKEAGIDLYTLIDAEDHEWRSYVSLPMLVDLRTLDEFQIRVSSTGRTKIPYGRFEREMLYRRDGSIIDVVQNLVVARLEDETIPNTAGEHTSIRLTKEATFVKVGGELFEVDVRVDARVSQAFHFGQLPLKSIQGLQDATEKDKIFSKGFTTSPISLDIVRAWEKVPSKESLAVKPVLTAVLSAIPDGIPPPS